MEVPLSVWLPVLALEAHMTSTPGAQTLTRGPCCEVGASIPLLSAAPTTMTSGYRLATRAGYLSGDLEISHQGSNCETEVSSHVERKPWSPQHIL